MFLRSAKVSYFYTNCNSVYYFNSDLRARKFIARWRKGLLAVCAMIIVCHICWYFCSFPRRILWLSGGNGRARHGAALGSQLVPRPVTGALSASNTPVIFLCTLLMGGSQVVCFAFSVAPHKYCLCNRVIWTRLLFCKNGFEESAEFICRNQ